ncbi:Rne/Rng family ribonuclease [Hoeflea prorocentri]|uniref:Ribonuclease E n=1 Tax=Hoeflea prorocentri TaxID=1922333 RepID=A0A9X3UHU4_9HYPH|nr:ribonuclease E/G [Hoeflea prorocentri]MCY6380891.1 Rne/Rng family ribonuclease [Hoeflea prorocentri]MDA5398691.1 Rne/Rng family ribonuclease [Hoeflea prorocentri]
MADKMLIDASHEEETRVVVVRGNRIEEFDFESQHKKQLRGNIYLAKVTRVEPSLQAAFVEYGGNRHGFLAFSEIHPDYYQIPVADRQALIEAEAAEAREEDDDGEVEKPAKKSRTRRSRSKSRKDKKTAAAKETQDASTAETEEPQASQTDLSETDGQPTEATPKQGDLANEVQAGEEPAPSAEEAAVDAAKPDESDVAKAEDGDDKSPPDSIAANIDADEVSEVVAKKSDNENGGSDASSGSSDSNDEDDDENDSSVESVGAEDALEEVPDRARKQRRQYRIQEVIKRRQILLVQVVKEERGNKGAALTTYLSLAGRYSVLMPNTARGGGISRKITNVQDRKRLKEVARGLEVPQGMGVILRTAGANRTKAEIKRDFEYLMRLWENVRNLTLTSTAPCLVYEEGSLIKRSIRDLYNKDIGEVIVSGEAGYREAKDFMKMLMPSHAKAVQPYRDVQPIFARSGIEAQLDKMLQPQVTLKSGGYIIINQTEALVAIDVNSGRSTKEHSIEDTALRTNLEAAEEVARQLRLRDLAGLIVIDFIDMEEKRNNRSVEKKLKECLKSDRARIQVGRISHFGLLEMSRQRIRASVLESTMQVCDACGGTGYVRSISSVALHVLRSAEEHLLKKTTHNITIRTLPEIALYVLNQKRDTIIELENRFGLSIAVEADPDVGLQHIAIDQGTPVESPVVIENAVQVDTEFAEIEDEPETSANGDEDGSGRKRKRRRRRRGRNGEDGADIQTSGADDGERPQGEDEAETRLDDDGEPRKKRRRRGKRGGKRNRDQAATSEETSQDASDAGTESDNGAIAVEVKDNTAETVTQDAAITEAAPDAADAGDEPAEKPKPRRRSRSKKADETAVAAETSSDEGMVAAGAEAAIVEPEKPEDDQDDAKPARSRRRRNSDTGAASEPKLTSTVVEDADAENGDGKPKKAGWWQRRGFF